MSNQKLLKNPILKTKLEVEVDNPSGNVLEELKEQSMKMPFNENISGVMASLWYTAAENSRESGYIGAVVNGAQS